MLAARAFDMHRTAGRFVVGIGPGDTADTRRALPGLEGLELTTVKPNTETYRAEIQPDPSAALFAHLARTLRTDHSEPRNLLNILGNRLWQKLRALISISVLSAVPHLSKLRTDPAGLDRHHDRLDGADLVIRDALFPGDAKIVLHSRIARGRHRGREVDQQRRLLIEDLVVTGRFVEFAECPVLFFWKQRALLSRVRLKYGLVTPLVIRKKAPATFQRCR